MTIILVDSLLLQLKSLEDTFVLLLHPLLLPFTLSHNLNNFFLPSNLLMISLLTPIPVLLLLVLPLHLLFLVRQALLLLLNLSRQTFLLPSKTRGK